MNTIDRDAAKAAGVSKLGAPYLFGAKWILTDLDPSGPVDCSGFSRWWWARANISVPEGSTAQHADAVLIDKKFTRVGDYAFLHTADPNVEHHVGIIYDELLMIESRGIIVDGKEIGNVCFHRRSEWEARPDFLGYFRPKSVVAIEGA